MNSLDRGTLYSDPEAFFSLAGSAVMRLNPSAAIAVCKMAGERGLVVARVEGGAWKGSAFESRIDCIWDGEDPPLSLEDSVKNNLKAAQFVADRSSANDVFIVTAPSMTGWPHKLGSLD